MEVNWLEVKDVATKRVFKFDAHDMMFDYSEDFVQNLYLELWNHSLKTGNTDELQFFLSKLRDVSARFVETALLCGRKGDSQPLVDFFLEGENYNLYWAFIDEKLCHAKKDGLEREVVIDFSKAETPFEIVFNESQIGLMQNRSFSSHKN